MALPHRPENQVPRSHLEDCHISWDTSRTTFHASPANSIARAQGMIHTQIRCSHCAAPSSLLPGTQPRQHHSASCMQIRLPSLEVHTDSRRHLPHRLSAQQQPPASVHGSSALGCRAASACGKSSFSAHLLVGAGLCAPLVTVNKAACTFQVKPPCGHRLSFRYLFHNCPLGEQWPGPALSPEPQV